MGVVILLLVVLYWLLVILYRLLVVLYWVLYGKEMRLGIMCRIQYWLLVDGVTHWWLQYCWLWDRSPMSGMCGYYYWWWLLVGNISIYLGRRLDDSSVS